MGHAIPTNTSNFASLRETVDTIATQLKSERTSFDAHWRELGENFLPRRTQFTLSDSNKGQPRSKKIIDATPVKGARVLRSGMQAGITSPARPWFRLSVPDKDLAENEAVKAWLHEVANRMLAVFGRSNIYQTLAIAYGDFGVFGTGAIMIEEDFETTIRAKDFPIGSFWCSNDKHGRVRTFYREFRFTVRQVVEEYAMDRDGDIDWSMVSTHVQTLWTQKHYETAVDLAHLIFPNPDHDPNNPRSDKKKFASLTWELGAGGSGTGSATATGTAAGNATPKQDLFLRKSGFDMFPVLVGRWHRQGSDSYGTMCPGMESLGDAKQLQIGEKRSVQAIEKMVNPPLKGPVSLQQIRTSQLPGDLTYVDERQGMGSLTPIHEVDPKIQELELKQQQVRKRIDQAFFVDLFLSITNLDKSGTTAREIDERSDEKLLALGPVLENVNQDYLDPTIDITFALMLRQGQIPEPPPELQGIDLKVEYVSIMAQAQKLVGLGGLERFLRVAESVLGLHPEAADKIDFDQYIDTWAEMGSLPPDVVRSDEVVAGIRTRRAEAEQQAAAAESAKLAAGAAKDLSQTELENDSALKRIVESGGAGGVAQQ